MTKKEYLSITDKCELCGSPKKLEIHHIIPLCVGGEDVIDNWLAICSSCHSKLTPNSQLTKIGLKRIKIQNAILSIYQEVYESLNNLCSSNYPVCSVDILDIFDSVYARNSQEALSLLYVKSRK